MSTEDYTWTKKQEQKCNFFFNLFLTAAGLAQSVERLAGEREVAGSIPGADQYSGS